MKTKKSRKYITRRWGGQHTLRAGLLRRLGRRDQLATVKERQALREGPISERKGETSSQGKEKRKKESVDYMGHAFQTLYLANLHSIGIDMNLKLKLELFDL